MKVVNLRHWWMHNQMSQPTHLPKAEYEEKIKNANVHKAFAPNNTDDWNIIVDDVPQTCHLRNVTFDNGSRLNANNSNIKINKNDEILIDEVCSEKIVSEVLRALDIHDSAWCESKDNTFWQVTFSIQDQVRSERTLRILRGADVGTRANTSLCVLPCSLYYKSANTKDSSEERTDEAQSAWSNFVQSVSARQTVAQVVEQIKADAALTFDYCFLIIVAALLAAIGLVENSTVFIVASMLISPLMGPIVAGSFGTAIRDHNLLKMGIMNELFGLFICLIIGFIFGLIVCSINEIYGVNELPTNEILSRSNIRSLWVGVLVALPSGAAVSIAILANNVSSLVGVAISASLLPPAVNAGLVWAMALIQWVCIYKQKKSRFIKTNIFSDNPVLELGIDGSISLCLTLVNIGCIYLAGILVYKIKEVAPATFNDSNFWRNAIKAVRDYNKSNVEDSKHNHKNLTNSRLRELTVSCSGIRRLNVGNKDIFKRLCHIGSNSVTWSPFSGIVHRVSAQDIQIHHRRHSESFTNNPHVAGNQSPLYIKLNVEDFDAASTPNSLRDTSPNFIEEMPEFVNNTRSKFTVVPVDEQQ